jgi:hypothetical protein
MADANDGQGKRKYEAPKVTVISLRPEEAVLGNCKTAGSLGGPSTGGPNCAFGTGCPVIGS